MAWEACNEGGYGSDYEQYLKEFEEQRKIEFEMLIIEYEKRKKEKHEKRQLWYKKHYIIHCLIKIIKIFKWPCICVFWIFISPLVILGFIKSLIFD